jgi:hypothetical protein
LFFDTAGTNYETFNLVTVLGSSRAGVRNSSREVFIEWYVPAIEEFVEGTLGKDYSQAKYMTFTIDVRSNTILKSNEYYKWRAVGNLDAENVDAKKNFYNPLVTAPLNTGQALNPRPFPTSQIGLEGSQQGQSDVDNALNVPYWDFPATTTLNQIELQSPNGNTLYGSSYQKTIAYSASDSTYFPGNKEPFDTSWPQQREPFNIQVGDEIRFENRESAFFTVTEVVAPQDTANFKLRLTLDREISPSINKDFFLIRRYVRDTSIIIINTEFPYPGTPGPTQKFVINTGTYISGSNTFQPATGSYVNVPSEPLSKKQLTTSAILFPEFPTAGIQNEPDAIIEQLRNNKLID